MRRVVVAVAAVALVAFGASGAEAAKPPAPSLTLDQSAPRLGDVVTFTATWPNKVRVPRVQIICRQDGVVVYASADHPTAGFLLGGGASDWLTRGGPADCRADLFDSVTAQGYASTSFVAGPAA